MAALAAAGSESNVRGPAHGTLAWRSRCYRASEDWLILSAATRRQRENIFAHVAAAGARPVGTVDQGNIVLGRDRRAKTPAQARNFLDAMRGLFKWAVNARLVRADPTVGVKNPRRKKLTASWRGPRRMWRAISGTGRGTRQRVWLDVLLYTGLRRGGAGPPGAASMCRWHRRDPDQEGGLTVAVTRRSCRRWRTILVGHMRGERSSVASRAIR